MLLWEPSAEHDGQFQTFNAGDTARLVSSLHRSRMVVDTNERVHGAL